MRNHTYLLQTSTVLSTTGKSCENYPLYALARNDVIIRTNFRWVCVDWSVWIWNESCDIRPGGGCSGDPVCPGGWMNAGATRVHDDVIHDLISGVFPVRARGKSWTRAPHRVSRPTTSSLSLSTFLRNVPLTRGTEALAVSISRIKLDNSSPLARGLVHSRAPRTRCTGRAAPSCIATARGQHEWIFGTASTASSCSEAASSPLVHSFLSGTPLSLTWLLACWIFVDLLFFVLRSRSQLCWGCQLCWEYQLFWGCQLCWIVGLVKGVNFVEKSALLRESTLLKSQPCWGSQLFWSVNLVEWVNFVEASVLLRVSFVEDLNFVKEPAVLENSTWLRLQPYSGS